MIWIGKEKMNEWKNGINVYINKLMKKCIMVCMCVCFEDMVVN